MSETSGVERLSRPVRAPGIPARPAARQRQGVRVTLLSLAAAILLLGAAIAAVFCYHAISTSASAGQSGWPAVPLAAARNLSLAVFASASGTSRPALPSPNGGMFP
jgi:hypothetical protein